MHKDCSADAVFSTTTTALVLAWQIAWLVTLVLKTSVVYLLAMFTLWPPLRQCRLSPWRLSAHFLTTAHRSESLSNLLRMMKASQSEATLIPLASDCAANTACRSHGGAQLQWFISCGRSDCTLLWRSSVFTTQEGDLGLRPGCWQDGTVVPFSVMTNPAGLSLIISTQTAHALTRTQTWIHGHKWSRSYDVEELLALKSNCTENRSLFLFIWSSHVICVLGGVPGKSLKHQLMFKFFNKLKVNVLDFTFFFLSMRGVWNIVLNEPNCKNKYVIGNSMRMCLISCWEDF